MLPPCLLAGLLLSLLLLLSLPPSSLPSSVEDRFASAAFPTSIFSPEGNLYQPLHAMAGRSATIEGNLTHYPTASVSLTVGPAEAPTTVIVSGSLHPRSRGSFGLPPLPSLRPSLHANLPPLAAPAPPSPGLLAVAPGGKGHPGCAELLGALTSLLSSPLHPSLPSLLLSHAASRTAPSLLSPNAPLSSLACVVAYPGQLPFVYCLSTCRCHQTRLGCLGLASLADATAALGGRALASMSPREAAGLAAGLVEAALEGEAARSGLEDEEGGYDTIVERAVVGGDGWRRIGGGEAGELDG